jgi:peptidoglycan/LPS O-acetylase OafA/YrhL
MNETLNYQADDPNDYAWSFYVHQPTDLTPPLTSEKCALSLTKLLQGEPHPALLEVAAEASSGTTAGLEALYAQPWLWAGGGLGSLGECPLQTCMAGTAAATGHAPLVFASVCIVPECHAADLASPDIAAAAERAVQNFYPQDEDTTTAATRFQKQIAHSYAENLERINTVNQYLGTGWTCGELLIPFRPWPWGIPYLMVVTLLLVSVTVASLRTTSLRQRTAFETKSTTEDSDNDCSEEGQPLLWSSVEEVATTTTITTTASPSKASTMSQKTTLTPATSSSTLSNFCWQRPSMSQSSSTSSFVPNDPTNASPTSSSSQCIAWSVFTEQPQSACTTSNSAIWTALDVRNHWKNLFKTPSADTAVLDGLRVGSLAWIMLGHLMAISSGTGAGYANPTAFLPPDGITNTFVGQLLFSSRLAVDTFLVLSGFLTVHVVAHKLPLPSSSPNHSVAKVYDDDANSKNDQTMTSTRLWIIHHHPLYRYLTNLPRLLITRVARIFPLYAMCLLFYTQIAPLLGGGPFWYQWLALLQPCHDSLWSNLLFVNNFWPPDQPITSTCFYHSWYLAVDLQLFLGAVGLVFWYQSSPQKARRATLGLWMVTACGTAIGAAIRHWSVNSFDGAAVVRYDTEAYAKPWIRAVAYLTGMYVAMLLPRTKLATRSPWRSVHHWSMAAVLIIMTIISFGTAFGAYARRACRAQDWPQTDECGSEWSWFTTWFYTSTSRAVWCVCVGILLHLCLGRSASGNTVAALLSWSAWTPLSHLTFGAYLIHPIIIFIWKLGGTQKEDFQLKTFAMDYVSVTVLSYSVALMAALTVEFPCAALWKLWTQSSTRRTEDSTTKNTTTTDSKSDDFLLSSKEQKLQVVYGSVLERTTT